VEAVAQPLERVPSRLERPQAPVVTIEARKLEGHEEACAPPHVH
jgi:hypothetical protein